MSNTITGVVTNGVVVPNSPLPEGACVEIHLQPPAGLTVSPELQVEFDDWERAGAGTVEMVETGLDSTRKTKNPRARGARLGA